MTKHDETVYLRHILDAIARIEEYLHRIDQDTFRKTLLLQMELFDKLK